MSGNLQLKEVHMYTDGASSGNPGPGGYGVVLLYNKHRKEISGGFRKTTNNRMELMAVIEGLKALKSRCKVIIHSDSKYIVDAVEKGWLKNWAGKGWVRNKKDKLSNPDLWKELYILLEEHEIEFRWVQGHKGDAENERCDFLAVKASQKSNLPADFNFELNEEGNSLSFVL
ncbi:MAG TPA: ribonuclease HI [Ignavibacteriaceae bacterium]|nr:ribonuclease HI [Ignavibacteriaceae bacterium]